MSVAILSVLTAGTMNYAASGRGGVPELTRAEMAGMLAGLSDEAMHYAMAKYCDDQRSFRLLQFHCIQVASGYAAKHGWRAYKGRPCIISMGCLAAIESVNALWCFACHSPEIAGGDKVCSCDKQRKKISSADRARYVGISIRQWNMVWRERYEYLFNYCQMLDGQVRDVLRGRVDGLWDKQKIAAYNKKYHEENKEKIAAAKKKYHEENKEKIAAAKKKYREENKEKIAAAMKKYYEENKEKIAAARKKYRKESKEKIAAARKKCYEKNKEKIAAAKKKYYEENKEKIAAAMKKYYEENKEKITARRQISLKKCVDNISDRYVLSLIKKQEKIDNASPEMIEIKRIQIKIHRFINQEESK